MKTTNDRHALSNGQGQGMNWIRKEKRLAIYMRDGLACCYCGDSVEQGAKLTLDHVKPHSKGGTHEASNLVTSCHRCNSARGNRSLGKFAVAVAEYVNHGRTPEQVVQFVRLTVRRKIDVRAAKAIMAQRASFNDCLTKGAL